MYIRALEYQSLFIINLNKNKMQLVESLILSD